MRVSAFAVFAAVLASATAFSLDILANPTTLDDDDSLKVPGDSPLKFCSADHGDDTVTIVKVDLSPNPPKA